MATLSPLDPVTRKNLASPVTVGKDQGPSGPGPGPQAGPRRGGQNS